MEFKKNIFTYFREPPSNYHLLGSILGAPIFCHVYWVLTHVYCQIFVVKSRVHPLAVLNN